MSGTKGVTIETSETPLNPPLYDTFVLEDLVSGSQTLALATRDYSTQSLYWAQTFIIFSSKAQACGESLKAYENLDAYLLLREWLGQ